MAEKETRFINPPNMLKSKVGGSSRGNGTIDKQAMLAAQAAIDSRAKDYPIWAKKDIEELAGALQTALSDKPNLKTHLDQVSILVHDIRTHGTTYGYPLITKVGTSLYDFCIHTNGSNAQLEVITAHVNALRAIIGQGMSGDGGEVGAELLNMLRLASNKFMASEHQ